MAAKKNIVVESTEVAVIEITEEYLRDRLYDVRGRKVMLDADLADMMNSFVNDEDNGWRMYNTSIAVLMWHIPRYIVRPRSLCI